MRDFENDDEEFEVPSQAPARRASAEALVETQGLSDEHNPVPVTQKDLESLQISDLQRTEFVAKMRDCDLYLRNIHSLFPHAVTINGVLKLVAAGIQVHKHRSQIMKEICSIPEPTTGLDTVEFDNMGNIIKKA
jgi:hypothetical protein